MQVLRLLEFEPIRRRFDIREADLPLIVDWVRQSGIRWGRDEAAREALGLPADRQNTWAHGLDRLLLGYAMPSGEGEARSRASCRSTPSRGRRRRRRSPVSWSSSTACSGPHATWLGRAASASGGEPSADSSDDFWRVDEALEGDLRRFTGAIDRLAEVQSASDFDRDVPLEVAREFLAEHLDAAHAGRGFLTGGVTFCALMPMRTIPFAVVCLVGMDYDAFPRDTPPLSFDLIARAPRRGDRSRRNDDRYLFLEALLAARQRFYVSYVGQDIQDNSDRPPSVLVSELLDALEKGYGVKAEGLVTKHPLQAFSPAYFTEGTGFFSYARENLDACRAAAGAHCGRSFFEQPLPERPEDVDPGVVIPLERLMDFLSNPARFLSIHRLGIRLAKEDVVLRGERTVHARFSGRLSHRAVPARRLPRRTRPHGAVIRRCAPPVNCRTAGSVRSCSDVGAPMPDASPRPHAPCCRRAGFRKPSRSPARSHGSQLAGRLPRVTRSGCLQLRCASLKAKDYLRAWVCHLVLHLARPELREPQSLLIGADKRLRLTPVSDARRGAGGLAEPVPTREYRTGASVSRNARWPIAEGCSRLRTRPPPSRPPSASGTVTTTPAKAGTLTTGCGTAATARWTTISGRLRVEVFGPLLDALRTRFDGSVPMDITALLSIALGRDAALPGAAPEAGDRLPVRVLEVREDGKVLVDCGRFRAVAEVTFPVAPGDEFTVRVLDTQGTLRLEVIRPGSAGGAGVAGWSPFRRKRLVRCPRHCCGTSRRTRAASCRFFPRPRCRGEPGDLQTAVARVAELLRPLEPGPGTGTYPIASGTCAATRDCFWKRSCRTS